MNKKRIEWADYAKLVTIFLVVLEHAEFNIAIFRLFRMPLFFLVSGYFANPAKYKFLPFFSRNVRFLLIPYITFNIINTPFSWTSVYLHPELYPNVEMGIDYVWHPLLGIMIGDDKVTSYSYLPCGPLWFLISLFFMKLLFYVSYKFCFLKKLGAIYWLFVIITSPLLFLLFKEHLNFLSLDSVFLAFPFYVIGFMMKKYSCPVSFKSKSIDFFVIVAILTYLTLLGLNNGFVDINGGVYGNSLIHFYFNGIVGSYMILIVCTFLPAMSNMIKYIGSNTVIVLGMHLINIRICKFVFVYLLHIPTCDFHMIHNFIIGCLAFILCVPIIKFINRFAPWIIGKQRI